VGGRGRALRWALVALAGTALLAVGGIGAYVLYVRHEGRNIRGSSTVEFATTQAPTVAAPRVGRTRRAAGEGVVWPTYGYSNERVRLSPAFPLRPPFRRVWTFHGRALLEFPPAVAFGRLYLTTFDGHFFALDAATGKPVWDYRSHRCGWASPAVAGRLVYQTFIGRACNSPRPGADGVVVAFDARSGRIRWQRTIGPTESSPLVAGGLVYVGDWNGDVWALRATDGRTRWRFHTGGEIKGSLALADGRVYVGSYDGHVYALDARTGKEAWRASAQARLGATGTFYSTPAVAYGRVYIGCTDGKVYSFGAASGKLRWSHGTGGWVYGSPAVWQALVLVGSYDRTFYAFDAATGDVRWRFRANGPISGSATVLGGVVYFSTLRQRTYALVARTGRLLWTWPDGKYSPVVADEHRLYLVGFGRLYGMVPLRRPA
jgi:outer membrane protein assembly factor BamB